MTIKKAPRCQACKEREAIWAMQYIASDEPSFSALGYHYRGFKVEKLCDECKEMEQAKCPSVS